MVAAGVARRIYVVRQRVAVDVFLRHGARRGPAAAAAAAPTPGRGPWRARMTNRGGGLGFRRQLHATNGPLSAVGDPPTNRSLVCVEATINKS
jgi:hypothetical protein